MNLLGEGVNICYKIMIQLKKYREKSFQFLWLRLGIENNCALTFILICAIKMCNIAGNFLYLVVILSAYILYILQKLRD